MPSPYRNLQTGVGEAEKKVPAGTEAVVAAVEGVSTTQASNVVTLTAVVPVTTPLEAEEVTIRIRRAGVAGTEVAKAAAALGASAHATLTLVATDTPGETAGMTYVVTLQEKKATVEDTAHRATIEATW